MTVSYPSHLLSDILLQLSSEIKTNIASSPNLAEDKLTEQAPSPYLVPALLVSVLLNLLTGGAIINNYIAPTERTDDGAEEPLQASSF